MYSNLILNFLKSIEDDLKEFFVKCNQYQKNLFHQVFLHISEMMMICSAHVSETLKHAQNSSTASNLSTSSNENTDEETSRQIFSVILDNITFFSEYHSISFQSLEYSLELYAHHSDISKCANS